MVPFSQIPNLEKDSKSFAHADARELMQEKEPMSRADFETILWPEIKEKIIPHLGNEFKAYDRNKELEGTFFIFPVIYPSFRTHP